MPPRALWPVGPPRVWANNVIARFGKVQDLKIDSRRNTVELSCLLDGEPTPSRPARPIFDRSPQIESR
jgi:hypothetical protein